MVLQNVTDATETNDLPVKIEDVDESKIPNPDSDELLTIRTSDDLERAQDEFIELIENMGEQNQKPQTAANALWDECT